MKKHFTWLLMLLLVFTSGLTVLSAEKQISALDILKELGINEVTITEDTPTGDTLVENPVTRIDFNNTSYAFLDEDGAITRIERVDEIHDLYTQNVSAETYESSFESVDELIDYIETYIIGEEYILTKEGHFDWKTLVLRYEKELSNGALDNYDAYSVYIDEQYTEITSLHKRTSDYTEQKTKNALTISYAKAIEIAEVILGEEMTSPKIEVEFATVKTNTCFDESVTPNVIKLAYIVKTDSTYVYVDAYTGEIIGGEIMKAVLGGAIGASELSTASASVTLAKSKLQNIGYNSTSAILTTQFKTDVPSRLKYAFYSCSHGTETYISSKKNEDDENRRFFARDVPEGTYKFVFLDACNTASNTWKNAFGISNSSTNKAFLG